MCVCCWNAETKLATPLEKNTKKHNAEKASYRQARVELTVLDFVQNLLLEDSDTTGIDVIPSFVDVCPAHLNAAVDSLVAHTGICLRAALSRRACHPTSAASSCTGSPCG